jgi:hypothetical protein
MGSRDTGTRVAVSPVPWNVPPPAVRVEEIDFAERPVAFLLGHDEHRGPSGEAASAELASCTMRADGERSGRPGVIPSRHQNQRRRIFVTAGMPKPVEPEDPLGVRVRHSTGSR